MNKQNFIIALLIISFAISLLLNCTNSPTEPAKTFEEHLTDGWLNFEKAQFQSAITCFENARKLDINSDEVHLGLAWSYAKIDSFEKANTYSKIAIHLNNEITDAYACYAFTSFQLNEYNQAIDAAIVVITREGEYYIFPHDPQITIFSLRLLLAQCYFETAQYVKSYQQVSLIRPDNSINVESETFIEDLCCLIESLGNL